MFEYLKRVFLNTSSIKIVFYIVGFLLSVPVIGMLYWIFDTSYLAEFGIGPELYSRPIFSSSLINAWLFVSTIGPSIWIWMALSGILFSFLVIAFYEADHKKEQIKPEENSDIDKKSWTYKIESVFNLIVKAGIPAIVFLFFGLFIIASTAIAVSFLSNESSKLASKQIKAYVNESTCKDAFNDYHLGCYSIPGEIGDDHLMILNGKDVIIYMSRKKLNCETEETFTITIKNKVTQEKIVRLFNYVEKPKKSKE
jgi:hypothetical protein